MELEQGRCRAPFTPTSGSVVPRKRSKGSAWLHTQVQEHSPEASSCQKTHRGVTFLCNDKSTGPDQDAAVGLLPGHHI